MPKRLTQSGFTLVELMITVAVIAILAAVALPSYQNFTIRTKVTECLTLSSAAKLAVALEVGRTGNATGRATAPGSFDPTRYCGDISISAAGEILMTTHNTGAGEDPVLQLTPTDADGSINWSCGLVSGSARHVPAQCRETALASNLPVGPSPGPPPAPTPPWTPPPSDPEPEPAPPAAPPDEPAPPVEGPTPPPPAPAPTEPTPPYDPPPSDGNPQPAPPAEPPAGPDPTDPEPAPPPAGAPPVDEPPSAPSPPHHEDYEEGSQPWCLLHPDPPGKCNKYK